jgi:hypothetical protein
MKNIVRRVYRDHGAGRGDAIRRRGRCGAIVGRRRLRQVYSQIVEREQFRNTTENNERSNGEVHHATIVC